MPFESRPLHLLGQQLLKGEPVLGLPITTTVVNRTLVSLYYDESRDWLWCVTTGPNGNGNIGASPCQADIISWTTVDTYRVAYAVLPPNAVTVEITTEVGPPITTTIVHPYFLAVLPYSGLALAHFRNQQGQLLQVKPIPMAPQLVPVRPSYLVRLLHWIRLRSSVTISRSPTSYKR